MNPHEMATPKPTQNSDFTPEQLAELPEDAKFPLKGWFEKMNEGDRLTIENDIFNMNGEPSENIINAFNANHTETARAIMGKFRDYLELKKSKPGEKAILQAAAKEVLAFVLEKFETIS
jgi:hypothetical protein